MDFMDSQIIFMVQQIQQKLKTSQVNQQIDSNDKKIIDAQTQKAVEIDKRIKQIQNDFAQKVEIYNSLIAMSGHALILDKRIKKMTEVQKQNLNIQSNRSRYILDFSNWYVTKLGLLMFYLHQKWDMIACIQVKHCYIDDDFIKTMIGKIEIFPNLKKIDAEQNNISEISTEYLQILKKQTLIVYFNLKNNPLTKQSIQNIEQFMTKNNGIQIQYSQISPQMKVPNKDKVEDENPPDQNMSDDQLDKMIEKLNKFQVDSQSEFSDDEQRRDNYRDMF